MSSRIFHWVGGLIVAVALGAGAAAQTGAKQATATFAGGCFWCMEAPFDKLPGVSSVTVGYTGGKKDEPTYREVSSGTTGHTEAVQIVYDPSKVTYQKLLHRTEERRGGE